MARFQQFSLRTLLGLTACCAALAGFWKAFLDEPPTHRFPAYEKAPSTRSWVAAVGPNTISIRGVARNDRDGNIRCDTGDGTPRQVAVPGEDLLKSCASWLDVAQFELRAAPGDFEVIEARVFDHRSRTLLSQVDPAFGWRMVAPNRLQVYGLGKNVPPLLDIWLRVHSYWAGDPVFVLSPQTGSEVSLPAGRVWVHEAQEGFEGWRSNSGLMPVKGQDRSLTALDMMWKGSWQNERYQVAAVSKQGEKQFEDSYLNLSATGDRRTLMMFDFPKDEIDHLELRPHGGRHRFFFEAVPIPAAIGRPFAPPPVATVAVNQGEVQSVVPELAPLKVAITLVDGRCVAGSRASSDVARIIQRASPAELGKAFSLLCDVRGIGKLPLAFRFQDAQSGTWVREADLQPASSYRASALMHQASSRTFSVPLQRVDAIEVSVSASP